MSDGAEVIGEEMVRRIVSTGGGRVEKTTFAALAAGYLSAPLLLIDIDPDQSLADMLGVDLEKEGVRTVLDVLFDIQKQQGYYEELSSMPFPDRIDYLLSSECLYGSERFDLVSLGVKWTEGCYCVPNNLLRGLIPRLVQKYAHVVIDAPAGLEHLNRKVTSEIDDLFVILAPSMKSLRNLERIRKLANEVGVRYRNFYLAANYSFTRDAEKRVASAEGIYLGEIEADAELEEYNLQGRSLLELPGDSPALLSRRAILARAGYGTS